MNLKSAISFTTIFFFTFQISAAVIGTNVPTQALTAERVTNLPAWKSYLENSLRQQSADQIFLHAEMAAHSLTNVIEPPPPALRRT